jgi:AsmA family protein
VASATLAPPWPRFSGVGAIDATGDSIATLLANGNGGVKMAMAGGDLSALLIDLSGLHFGNALLSALGMPQKTPVKCFVSDVGLRQGKLDLNTMVLDTGEAITNVDGNIDLRSERIDLNLKTDAKHFTVGSLPTHLNIAGTFKDATIRPGAQAVARAGAVVGLAALFAPLAILPTLQLGTSEQEDARCRDLFRHASPSGRAPPPPLQAASGEEQAPAEH